MVDGDGVDSTGAPNNTKPGFAGHWIIRFSSGYEPKLVHQGQYITAKDAIKRGYFIRVVGSCSPNTGAQKAGVYMNLEAIELVAYGEEIKTGIDAVGAFARSAPAYIPPGASSTPMAPPAGMPQGVGPASPQYVGTPAAQGQDLAA